MSIVEAAPSIACTLAPGAYKDRLAWIAELNRDALLGQERRDLVLELRYARRARARVHEMVRNEQACCGFLSFEVREGDDQIHLTLTAPEEARGAAEAMFDQFVAAAPVGSSCGCASSKPDTKADPQEPAGVKTAGLTAATLATGAVACGACCVLPFALPATVLASTGGLIALVVKMHLWMTLLAIAAVAGAWAWIGWQSAKTRRRPARSTLVLMIGATAMLSVAVLWPLIEMPIIYLLRA